MVTNVLPLLSVAVTTWPKLTLESVTVLPSASVVVTETLPVNDDVGALADDVVAAAVEEAADVVAAPAEEVLL